MAFEFGEVSHNQVRGHLREMKTMIESPRVFWKDTEAAIVPCTQVPNSLPVCGTSKFGNRSRNDGSNSLRE